MSALGIATGAVSAGLGIYNAIRQNKAAKKQHERQKELQEHAQEQQLKTWNQTNFEAQRKHLEAAGLNVGLMYGMGGTGGATVGSGGVGQAAQENVYDLGTALQAKTALANIELAKSQAKKNEAEAEKIAGVDTEQTSLANEWATIQNEIAGKTMEEQMYIIKDKAKEQLANAVIAQHDQVISEQTIKERVSEIKEKAIGAMLQNEATRSGINLNEARIHEISQTIAQAWERIDVDREGISASLENMKNLTNAMLWSAGINATGHLVGDIVDIATRKAPKGSTETVTERRGKNWTERRTDKSFK